MKNILLFLVIILDVSCSFSQSQSIMQEQLNYYNSLGNATATYYEENTPLPRPVYHNKSNCNLNKIVYGWHPYWGGNTYLNYDWLSLSHFSFFSYEVNASNGNANDTHDFQISAAVDEALNHPNVKVTLCVTLFSNHSTFLTNSTSMQTLIDNLINLIQSRGAHGVNIDFEGLPSSQKTNFANFMVNLANQMHTAIPGSHVSTVLYAVDWSDVFDFSIMNTAVDHYIVMGYDYYYSGSSTAGPNDPLYHFGTSFNYTLSKSLTYYLDSGCPSNKLVLGLPYYGREWPTSSTSVPSSTTGTGVSRTYATVKNNFSGYYSPANHQFENESCSDIFVFNNGGTRQCFITLEDAFRKRLKHVIQSGIAGIGIWALGYDDGYSELWDAIDENLTECYSTPCSDTIYDFGGPYKNYNNYEDYTWTIAPPGATSIQVNFNEFMLEEDYDFLYIYDGASASSPQIAGSPFTGTNSPGTFNSSSGALTFRFTSDYAIVDNGFLATYYCVTDTTIPVTNITVANNWQTADFATSFQDSGLNGIESRFFNVSCRSGVEWRSNTANGFFNDNFNQPTIHPDWQTIQGVWSQNGGLLIQSDQANSNTNLYTSLNQNGFDQWLHHFYLKIGGTGTNKRAGYHFMCDDGSLTNRGNSYFVWFRSDDDKIQIYEVNSDVLSLEAEFPFNLNNNQQYDVKITYDKISGKIMVWLDNVFVASWIDVTPLTVGNAISFRSGNAEVNIDNLSVYHGRSTSEVVSIGSPTGDIFYQNMNPMTPSGKIRSIVIDTVDKISINADLYVNVDWTPPVFFLPANDGLSSDVDVFFNTLGEISGSWNVFFDQNSGIQNYEYSIGTASGSSDFVPWTTNSLDTFFNLSGLNLIEDTTYYICVRATNIAGLTSNSNCSDGALFTEGPLVISSVDNSQLLIYPNPFTNSFIIDGLTHLSFKNIKIQIHDISGQLVYKKDVVVDTDKLEINDLDRFKKGIYFIEVSSENDVKISTTKLVKR